MTRSLSIHAIHELHRFLYKTSCRRHTEASSRHSLSLMINPDTVRRLANGTTINVASSPIFTVVNLSRSGSFSMSHGVNLTHVTVSWSTPEWPHFKPKEARRWMRISLVLAFVLDCLLISMLVSLNFLSPFLLLVKSPSVVTRKPTQSTALSWLNRRVMSVPFWCLFDAMSN